MPTCDIQRVPGPPDDTGGSSVGAGFDTTALQLRLNYAGTLYNFAPTSTGPARVPANPTTAVAGTHQFVEVTIPAASVLTLRATPYEIIPTPGAGRIVLLLGGTIMLVYNSVAYTESTANLVLRYTNTSGALVSAAIEATGLADATVNTMSTIVPGVNAVVASTAAANQNVVLHNTGAGEWANSGNSTLRVKVAYIIVAST